MFQNQNPQNMTKNQLLLPMIYRNLVFVYNIQHTASSLILHSNNLTSRSMPHCNFNPQKTTSKMISQCIISNFYSCDLIFTSAKLHCAILNMNSILYST